MKETEIQSALIAAQKTVDDLSAARDQITEQLKKATAHRADLETKLKLIALPASPIRAQVLAAAGIESGEAVMNS